MQLSQIYSSVLPFRPLLNISGFNLFLPFYHTISSTDLPHIKHLYKVKTPKEFEKELDFILKYFKPISAQDLTVMVMNREPCKDKVFLLSFDDGLREMYDVVYPILKRKGIPALFFLNSAFVDNKDLFFRYKASLLIECLLKKESKSLEIFRSASGIHLKDNKEAILWILSMNYTSRNKLNNLAGKLEYDFNNYLENNKPYLTTGNIKEMADNGFDFGAHSIDHPYFSEIPIAEQLLQANESIKWVMENFGSNHSYFSFPFSDDGVSKEFYNKLYTDTNPHKPKLIFGSSGLKKDEFLFVLHRLCMEKMQDGERFMHLEYARYIFKTIFRRNLRKHHN
jgi:hypothetical protein